ncbi:MAG: HAD family hydrolase [Chloroflexi bacterium]|jgi:phosphoserine phosphatase|nr:HAD family hydrolase [Chloroflexota bacterium]
MKNNINLLHSAPNNRVETVASDLEGTLSAGAAWQGMRGYLINQGREQAYKRFFLRKMPRYLLFRLGLVSQESMKQDWILGLLQLFVGYTAEQMAELGQWVVENEIWPKRRQSVVDELLSHLDRGRRVIINTGQFEPLLAELLPEMEGVEGIGTPLILEDGRITGRLAGPLNTGVRKVEQLEPFARDGLILSAYGDSEQDIPMLEMSNMPVAVYPDRGLKREAENRGWPILEDVNTSQRSSTEDETEP